MRKSLLTLLIVTVAAAGCESKPKTTPPPRSEPFDAPALESLRTSLGSGVQVAGVSRVLPADDFLALEGIDPSNFPVGTPVSIIDSRRDTLAQGSVAAIVGGEAHVQFTVTGPRRPQTGDAAVVFPRQ